MSEETPDTGATTTNLEEAQEAGFFGTHQDPEPNESYAVGGKLAQQPEAAKPDTSRSIARPSSGGKSSSKSSS